MSRSYTSSPPKRLHGVYRDCFTFYDIITFILLYKTKMSYDIITFILLYKIKMSYHTLPKLHSASVDYTYKLVLQ
jgi:hypothetical protein